MGANVLTNDHANAVLAGNHSHGPVQKNGEKPVGSRAERVTSFNLADIPVPTGREEEWRFTPFHKFEPLFNPVANPAAINIEIEQATIEKPHIPVVEAGQRPGLETTGAAAAVTFNLEQNVPASDPRFGTAGKPGDRTAVAGWHAAETGTIITVPAQAVITEPLMVRVVGQNVEQNPTPQASQTAETSPAPNKSDQALTQGAVKLLINAEPHSQAIIVIDHTGPALLNETIELVLKDGAQLTVVALQDWAKETIHAASHRAVIGADATLKHIVVSLGGDAVRITPDAAFTGADGSVEMLGLYFADAGQHLEHRLFVDHGQPSCTSRVTYKGALQGDDAHTVWVGDVLIQANATDTDTYEMNRNLVLTKGARADSVPNLEIETGEIIGAGHASATGRFDDEQLFYLMARGIPEKEARRLVVRGFFAELIGQIGVPEVEQRLLASIEGELATSPVGYCDPVSAGRRKPGDSVG